MSETREVSRINSRSIPTKVEKVPPAVQSIRDVVNPGSFALCFRLPEIFDNPSPISDNNEEDRAIMQRRELVTPGFAQLPLQHFRNVADNTSHSPSSAHISCVTVELSSTSVLLVLFSQFFVLSPLVRITRVCTWLIEEHVLFHVNFRREYRNNNYDFQIHRPALCIPHPPQLSLVLHISCVLDSKLAHVVFRRRPGFRDGCRISNPIIPRCRLHYFAE